MEEPMEEYLEVDSDEEYEKCGEVFLTVKGNITFHCTFCEVKFKGFELYGDHLKIHYEPNEESIQNCNTIAEEIHITPYYEEASVENDNNIEILVKDDTPQTNQSFGENAIKLNSDKVKRLSNRKRNKKDTKLKNQTIPINDVPSSHKKLIEDTHSSDSYHELPSCDRPILKCSRKPVTSLADEERKHKCPYCSFASRDKTNLWSHIQRHSNNKPHQCSYCPKNFHTRVELTFHTRYHTGERPFLCTECGRTFVTKEQLKQHMKRHFNQRDHKCIECDKSFFSAQELREHMTVHTKETPFKCDLCGSLFTRRKALMAHKKLHENKRSYKCQLCVAGFNQSAGLYLHMKTKHHVTKPSSSNEIFET